MYSPAELEIAQERIKSGLFTCILMNNGLIVEEAKAKGVRPILQFLESNRLQGAEVADKIVGKAAATLLVLGGAKYVYGELMSKAAQAYLQEHDIPTSYGRLIEEIKNRDGTGMCPLEESVINISDPQEGYTAIKETIARLMAK